MSLKTYRVVKIKEGTLQLDGKGLDPLWEKATRLTHFCSPWDATPIKTIQFKALWDQAFLYCCFKVDDSEIYTDTTDNSKNSISNSDRVELFFRADPKMSPYYCLEIDPTPRVMDFKALPNRVFDLNWNWPQGEIMVKSNRQVNFFTVEIALSLSSLKSLGLLNNGQIETGIYRAKYVKHKAAYYKPIWITWVDPKTKTPDFHTPTAFGVLELENGDDL